MYSVLTETLFAGEGKFHLFCAREIRNIKSCLPHPIKTGSRNPLPSQKRRNASVEIQARDLIGWGRSLGTSTRSVKKKRNQHQKRTVLNLLMEPHLQLPMALLTSPGSRSKALSTIARLPKAMSTSPPPRTKTPLMEPLHLPKILLNSPVSRLETRALTSRMHLVIPRN